MKDVEAITGALGCQATSLQTELELELMHHLFSPVRMSNT